MKNNLLNLILISIGVIISLAGTIGVGTSVNSPFTNIVWIFQVIGIIVVIFAIVRIIINAKNSKVDEDEFSEMEEENDRS